MFRSPVFQGRVRLLRANPKVMKLVIGAVVVQSLAVIGLFLVAESIPESLRGVVAKVVMGASCVAYIPILSRYLRPFVEVVNLHVDQRGLFANESWLMPRDAICEAYIRPATAAQQMRGVLIPPRPLTIELVSTAAPLVVDPGSELAAQQILHALGFPITVVSPTYVPRKVKRK
jgi:hypothetical protein